MYELLIILFCISAIALLSCIEMAFITVSKAHLKVLAEAGRASAKRILHLKINSEKTLSSLQIGITLLSAISAAIAGSGSFEYLSPKLSLLLNLNPEISEYIAIIIVVLPLAYLSTVAGELVPKSIARRSPLQIVLAGSLFLTLLNKVFHPFVVLLDFSTKFFTHFLLSKFKTEKQDSAPIGVDLEGLSETHKQYVFNLINVNKRNIKDVMLPWDKVTKIYEFDHQHDVLEKIKASRHTRMPVVNMDGNVIGLLHTKEFVSETEITKIDWKQLIRSVIYLTPSEPLLMALKKLQANKSHIAIIKHDTLALGIVTIEDIIEEVVGELNDEDDEPNTLLALNSRLRNIGLNK